MEKKVYRQVGVRVSDEFLKQVEEFAAKEQRSIAQVFRIAVEQYINKTNQNQ